MDDFKRVSFFQDRRAIGLTRDNIAIQFNHDPSGTDIQFLEELGDGGQSLDDFSFSPFTFITGFTEIKNRIRKDRRTVAREYGFKLVPK